MSGSVTPAFIDGQRGRLFVLLRRPAGASTAECVLVVPAFAEEMNKCRPMLGLVARNLAARGIATVIPDLYGTGDSEGEFRDGDWSDWQDNLARVVEWATGQGCRVSRLLCVRLGCILGAEAVQRIPTTIDRTVFWQPILEGKRFMTQFLRLRVAASMMEDSKETVGELREVLQAGGALEVAGYELSAVLLGQIDGTQLANSLNPRLGQLHWMEIVRADGDALSPASLRVVDPGVASSGSVMTHAIVGEPFWSATEIVRIPGLVNRTVEALAGHP